MKTVHFPLLLPFVLWIAFALGCVQSNMNAARNDNTSSAPEAIVNWEYAVRPDEMGRGNIKTATSVSTNTVNFDFPYSGEQHAHITIRKHPEHGNDVMLGIDRGQFLTGVEGCTVTLRFDDRPPMKFHANGAADNSTNLIFIDGFGKIVDNLKHSKRLRIEAPFYREGNQVFEFNVEGFLW
jgi:hypothetical protein